jgi:GntR family transcriptional repressor for pyruvate dehydrogenase complex
MGFRSVILTRSYEQVVEQIQDGIRSGTLVPGQRLPTERELGESFGVSRAVVREALKVLAAMGLVESRQGSGNFITSNPVPSITRALILSATPQEESLLALFEVREPLEALAARRAAERRSPEQSAAIAEAAQITVRAGETDDLDLFGVGDFALHGGIFAAAGNPYLTTVSSAVREVLNHALHLVTRITGTVPAAASHHVRIADAITRQDADAAAAEMAAHIRYNADALRDMIAAGHIVGTGRIGERPGAPVERRVS